MSKQYIEVEKIINFAEFHLKHLDDGEAYRRLEHFLEFVERKEEGEKRGKWIHLSEDDYKCSNCNDILTAEEDCHPIDDCGMVYCPTCGAKMDLGEE